MKLVQGMVRWLAFAGKSGFWKGLHANLVQKVDAMLMAPAFSVSTRSLRMTVGYCTTARPPTQRKPTNHCDMRFPSLPPFPTSRQNENAVPLCLRIWDVNAWEEDLRDTNYKRACNEPSGPNWTRRRRSENVAAQKLLKSLEDGVEDGAQSVHKSIVHQRRA